MQQTPNIFDTKMKVFFYSFIGSTILTILFLSLYFFLQRKKAYLILGIVFSIISIVSAYKLFVK